MSTLTLPHVPEPASTTMAPGKSVEWYTPAWIFERLGLEFDLDPAHPALETTYVPTARYFTRFEDGLKRPWTGRVWLNPPFGPDTGFWMRRLIDHGHGIALVFSRTDTTWCQEALHRAHAVLFMAGRIEFVPGRENAHKKSRAGAGTVMFAFGIECADALSNLSDQGVFLRLPQETQTEGRSPTDHE